MNKTASRMIITCFLCVLAMFIAAGFSACGGEGECSHEWDSGAITQEATCEQEGVILYKCTLCGETKTEAIEKISHAYEEEWTADGTGHYHICTVCGEADEVTAHIFEDTEVFQAATETQSGVMGTVCTACGYEGTREIPALSHTASDDWSSDENYHWQVCAEHDDCGVIFNRGVHTWNEGEQTSEGVIYTCTICGTAKKESAVMHSYDNANGMWTWSGYTQAVYTVTCADCGDTINYTASISSKVTTEATADTNGVMTYTATVMIDGVTYTNNKTQSIPATGQISGTVSADFTDDFSTENQNGAWGYGTVSYSWDAGNPLTYSNGSESFSFTAATSLNTNNSGWVSGSAEIKAGWINVGEMTGISYTASKDMVVALDLTYTGNADDTALSLRLAVVSSDGTAISFICNAKEYTYSTTLKLKAGNTIYFIFNNEGSGYPQADLSISVNELSATADYTTDFSTASSTGAWSYGTVSYSWDSNNQLTYSNGSESFDFTAASELNSGGDGWIADNIEIKADWINAGSMTGISYTASEDMTAAVMLSYTGSATDTALSLRVAVVSSDGTTISFICNANSYDYSTTLELKAGDTIYFIFNNEGTGYPQADLAITIYEAMA